MPVTKEKKKRMEAIRKLIGEKRSIGSQQELVELLAETGIRATQSSVSRDLQDLGVKRVRGRYVTRPWVEVGAGDFEDTLGFVQDVKPTGPNLVVMLTSPNAAAMVAEGIKSSDWPEVAGILTGDDTIFIATVDEEDQIALLERLSKYVARVIGE